MKPADVPDRDLAAILGVPEASLHAPAVGAPRTGRLKTRRWPVVLLAVVVVGGSAAVLLNVRLQSSAGPHPPRTSVDATAERRSGPSSLAQMMINAPSRPAIDTPADPLNLPPGAPVSQDQRLADELTHQAPLHVSPQVASLRPAQTSRSSRDRSSARLARAFSPPPNLHRLRPVLHDDTATLETTIEKPSGSAEDRAARLDRLEALDAIRLLRQK